MSPHRSSAGMIGALVCLLSLLDTVRVRTRSDEMTFANANVLPPVVGIRNDLHAVNGLDKTLAFYRDVFGLDGETQPQNRGLAALTNSPGAHVRFAVLDLPNTSFGFELAEFSGVERKPGRLRVSDPGSGTLILRVLDLDRVVDAAKAPGAEMVTPGGVPVKLRPAAVGTRAILMRDPDGYLVEGEELSSSGGSPSDGNVQSAGMQFAMADRDATLRFYGELLGLKLAGRMQFSAVPMIAEFAGVPQGTLTRALSVEGPGTNPLVFVEFKDLPLTALRLRVFDPGAPGISLRVTDLDGLLKRMRAAGVPIVSAGGKVVQLTTTVRSIFVGDPNGINVELYEAMQ
jgi:catechol 2,3-dioxygenase-like lactoylglutathione lyase family enzyme